MSRRTLGAMRVDGMVMVMVFHVGIAGPVEKTKIRRMKSGWRIPRRPRIGRAFGTG